MCGIDHDSLLWQTEAESKHYFWIRMLTAVLSRLLLISTVGGG